MSLIVLKVRERFNRWAVVHNDVAIATFDTKASAERAALAVAARHPQRNQVEVDLIGDDGQLRAIRVF